MSAASRGAREVIRPLAKAVGEMDLPYRVPKTLGVRLSRVGATATKGYPGVGESPVLNLLRRLPGVSRMEFEQGHIFLQQRWFRAAGPTAWYPESVLAQRGLQRLGNAGWNLMPLPRGLNQALGRSPWGSAAFGVGVVGGGVGLTYGSYKGGQWVAEKVVTPDGQ